MKRRVAATILVAAVLLSGLGYYVVFPPGTGGNSTTPTGSTSSSSTTSTTSGTASTTSPSGSSTTQSTSSVYRTNWTTYHGDNAHTGYDPSVNFTSVRQNWKSDTLDGAVYAEPLILGNEIFVATENNSIYALDAQNGSVRWRTNFGSPVLGSSLPCGNINPSGITGTPVIDASTRTIYAVAFLNPPHHVLFAVDIQNGTVRFQRPADAVGSNPTVEQQRAALTLANGMVYVPYGGLLGDCGDYHGWVVGVKSDGTGSALAFEVPTGREGGIWGPSGAVVDSSGSIYVATGNGASGTSFDYGNSVIRLSPTLSKEGFFAPSNWASLNQADTDLGSLGPALLGSNSLFQIGKEGVGYLLRTDSLGGIGGQVFSGKVCGSAFGGTAFAQPYLFVPCVDGLAAVRIDNMSFSVIWRSDGFYAGPPIVTGGVVWTVDVSSAVLRALRVSDGKEIFNSPLGHVTHFCTPAIGDGMVIVAANNQLVAFLLT